MCICRVQYAQWKEECREMFPLIGSGRFITAPIINDRGEPIQDPLVLLETNLGDAAGPGTTANGTGNSNGLGTQNAAKNNDPMSKKEIQWKLTLHQIGRCCII